MGPERTKNRQRKLICAFFSIFCLLLTSTVSAQKPVIKSIDKDHAAGSHIVTIHGDNFGTNSANLVVFFGSVKGIIKSVSNQVLEVEVPPGATYNNISVTNISNTSGLTGYSKEQFLLSYGGDHADFDATKFATQVDFNAEDGVYDLCLCDFDSDKRSDVITATKGSNTVKLLSNTTVTPGTITFSGTTIAVGASTLHAKCGDLNGDGKPDFILSEENGKRLFIYKNNSSGTGNFNFTQQIISISAASKLKRIEIADMDTDGKPELIITDQGSNKVFILPNTSDPSTGVIQFNTTTPAVITISNAATTDGLDVKDLNGDNLPEIVTMQSLSPTANVYVIQNNSVPGTIAMGTITTTLIPNGSLNMNLRIGDLDGDKKPDIAVAQLTNGGYLSVILNQSSSGTLSLGAPQSFTTGTSSWGLDIGDLDGDGKAEIVLASITPAPNLTLTILSNNSSPGSLSFTKLSLTPTYITRHVNIGDVDGDGKPDIVAASVKDTNVDVSQISIFRNKSCLVPEVTPPGPLNVCSGYPLKLLTAESKGTTFVWKNAGSTVASGSNAFYDVTASGTYTVTATTPGCSKESNTVTVTVGTGSVTGTADITPKTACIGSNLNLSVINVTGAISYSWTGPNGFTATGVSPSVNVTNNFQEVNAGKYTVQVFAGTCVAQEVSIIVNAIGANSYSISYSGSNVICSGNKTLQVDQSLGGETYEWYEGSTKISGQTNATLSVSASGNYYSKVTYGSCVASETNHVNIIVATPPTADFTAPSSACIGQLIQFSNASTTDLSATPSFSWAFGDNTTSTEENAKHTYTAIPSPNPVSVSLTVTYAGGVCANMTAKNITLQSATAPVITNPTSTYKFCPGDSIRLEVLGSYNSYKWNNNAALNANFIYAKEADTYTVEVTTASCTLNASRTVQTFSKPLVVVSANPQQITEGESTQLIVEGLISNILWSPAENLSDATSPTPTASPTSTTVYTVTGSDENSCKGTATVEVRVKGDAIVSKLTPKKFFSPNDDAVNPHWSIDKIGDYPQCSVSVYDDKGVKVYEAKPYLNDWDGTFKGKKLPDGVYFYIIRCDGEENTPKKGSITILR